jgi:hypothetical protein
MASRAAGGQLAAHLLSKRLKHHTCIVIDLFPQRPNKPHRPLVGITVAGSPLVAMNWDREVKSLSRVPHFTHLRH